MTIRISTPEPRDPMRTSQQAALLCSMAIAATLPSTPARAGQPQASLRFDEVFRAKAERGPIHYRATFVSQGIEHQLEVWRDGATRLKRATDQDVETYVVRKPGDAGFEMTVLDLRKKILTRIDRSNLYRIGNFTDWFDLAHGLRHPKGEYRLTRARGPQGDPKLIETCTWYTLTQQGRASHMCWSVRSELPLMIVSQGGQVVWRLTQLDRAAIPPGVFVIQDRGFVRNDANEDIERD